MNNKVSRLEQSGFFLGGVADSLIYLTISTFLLFFYTDVFGISPIVAGTLFLVARIWDAVNDPLLGTIADKTKTKWGSFRPYIMFGAIPLAVFAVLCFTVPDISNTGKIVWAYVTYIGMGMCYTIVALPSLSLLSASSQKTEERTLLSSSRSWGSMIGALLATGSMLTLVQLFGNGDSAKGYQLATVFFAVIAAAFFIYLGLVSKERVPVPKEQKVSTKEAMSLLSKNKPWIVLNIFFIAFFLWLVIFKSLGMYYFTYYIGDGLLFGTFNIVNNIPTLIVIPFIPKLNKYLEKKQILQLGAIVVGMSGVMLMLAKTNVSIVMIAAGVNAVGMGMMHPIMWSMLPDTVEYGEWVGGKRIPGLTVSAASFAQKAAQGVAGWLASIILVSIAFKAGADVQSATTQEGIYFWFSIVSILLGVVTVVVMHFYSLDEKTYQKILIELKNRPVNDDSNSNESFTQPNLIPVGANE